MVPLSSWIVYHYESRILRMVQHQLVHNEECSGTLSAVIYVEEWTEIQS